MKDNYSYWRSTLTGQCYKFEGDWMPKYDGWEAIHQSTYEKWCYENGLEV